MGIVISIYLDDETERRLRIIGDEVGRSVEDLAECAVAEAALDALRDRVTGDRA